MNANITECAWTTLALICAYLSISFPIKNICIPLPLTKGSAAERHEMSLLPLPIIQFEHTLFFLSLSMKRNETRQIGQMKLSYFAAARNGSIVSSLPCRFVQWQLIKALQISIPRRNKIVLKWIKLRWVWTMGDTCEMKWSNGEIFPCKNKTREKKKKLHRQLSVNGFTLLQLQWFQICRVKRRFFNLN